jgi:cyclopropane fatty-acyl-phospholipid synthase-like methyltransferase
MNFGERPTLNITLEQADAVHAAPYIYTISQINTASMKYVCDVGCAGGYGSEYLSRHGLSVLGVDIDKNSIESATKLFSNSRVRFECIDINRLPSNRFDVVTCFQVIEHVGDYYAFLEDIHRILKPQGKAFISTPNKVKWSPRQAKPHFPFHTHEFYPKELLALGSSLFQNCLIKGQFNNSAVWREEIKDYEDTPRCKNIRRLLQWEPCRVVARITPQFIKDAISRPVRIKEDVIDYRFSVGSVEWAENILLIGEKGE